MITERLADFVARRSTDSLPEEAFGAAANALIDTVGVAIAGSREPVAEIAAAWVDETGSRGRASLWNRAAAAHPADAAFANAISAHALDYDDTHPSARGHMSAGLVPTAIAIGEASGASGQEVLAAYVVALEVAGAIGRMFGPGHLECGWHPTATVGALATTALAARLYGLDVSGVARAFGLAGSQVGGLARNFGTMAKPFHAGHAARTGVLSAALASKGLTANETLLDGKRGVIDVYSTGDGEAPETVLADLGETWEVLSPGNYVKNWPCCYSGHRTIGTLFRMMDEHGFIADGVAEVAVSFLPGGDTALVSRDPHTGLEGKFSIEYMVAAALLDGRLVIGSFTDEMVQRPEARALMKRVRRVPIQDEKFYSGIAGYNEISVTTRNGDTFKVREARVPGSQAWPMSEEERDRKFLDCASENLSAEPARSLLHALHQIRSSENIGELTSSLATDPKINKPKAVIR